VWNVSFHPCIPDDGHTVAQNMSRKEINVLRKIVHQVGFIYKSIQGCTVNKTLKKKEKRKTRKRKKKKKKKKKTLPPLQIKPPITQPTGQSSHSLHDFSSYYHLVIVQCHYKQCKHSNL
jgi:hypothetical protein